MKPESKSKPMTKPLFKSYSALFGLVVIAITALQMGCSSTGSTTQQVFRPQTQAPGYYGNPAWGQQGQFPAQVPYNNQASPYGGSGTSYGGGSGTSLQSNPYGGGSGTSQQASSGSGTREQFGAGFPNFQQQQQQYFQTGYNPQSGFNPFGFAKTSC